MNTTTRGWINGMIGVAIFSGSLPATRLAVLGLDPLFVTAARAALAGLLALAALALTRSPRPGRADLRTLLLVAFGVVFGFPLFSALALRTITSAHSLVFIGLLPLATAIFGTWLGGERPSRAFWMFAVLGAASVAGFALSRDGSGSLGADALMMIAIVTCGYGYAEGGRLSRRLGGWQVICWVLALSLPVSLPLAVVLRPAVWTGVAASAWGGLAYVAVFSMLVGFIFWYRGLAQGGIAAVGQLQLLQPFMGLMLAAWLLGEPVTPVMLAVTAFVVACVAGAKYTATAPALDETGRGTAPAGYSTPDESGRPAGREVEGCPNP
ncbi:DMT family transporter [Castellaniella denitrificans]|uniref:DMT family transporter n=1 Tax=Castellaniella denitrificans TaxID=56119 RepID=UPI001AC1BBB5|nr:DMT family transporter [Burkholderiales bacterium]